MMPASWVLNFWWSLKLVHQRAESPSGPLNARWAREASAWHFSSLLWELDSILQVWQFPSMRRRFRSQHLATLYIPFTSTSQ